MSTDNTHPSATQSGSGRLIAGIAIGCGCSLIMALGLLAVLFVVLNLWYVHPSAQIHIRQQAIPVTGPFEWEVNPTREILKPAGSLSKPVVSNGQSPLQELEQLPEQKQSSE
ncbi:MAG: hypothetical protein FWC50_11290 [Planctomycetaceae bacterium]|nr:hypothetical protein [Planctomycetaceae bacterium]